MASHWDMIQIRDRITRSEQSRLQSDAMFKCVDCPLRKVFREAD